MQPRNPQSSLPSLWVVRSRQGRRAGSTSDASYSVANVTISPDGKWIGFHGMSASRYERGNLEQNDYADLYLLERRERATIERLTKNDIITEGSVSFSPDSKTHRVLGAGRFQVHAQREDLHASGRSAERAVEEARRQVRLDVRVGGGVAVAATASRTSFWSAKGDTIYFGTGITRDDAVLRLLDREPAR